MPDRGKSTLGLLISTDTLKSFFPIDHHTHEQRQYLLTAKKSKLLVRMIVFRTESLFPASTCLSFDG
ncbi:hypothetical protein ABAC460_13775 [Asticcacaulis sp. AC460]|nr:hypothetical protein ABAC460_13775 [Asticcacaulis sp. AC460]